MIQVVPGVRLQREVAIWAMCTAVHEAYKSRGLVARVTSGCEGKHSTGSEHYVGHAVDWRTRDVPSDILDEILTDVIQALGPDYDVLLEVDPPHLHTEWDPK